MTTDWYNSDVSRLAIPRPSVPSISLDEIQHLVLENVSWGRYSQILRDLRHRALRVTYDQGRLEIMSPLPEHERPKSLIGKLITILALELDRPAISFGSSTYRRKDKAKGAEPDDCYYFRDEAKMRGRRRLDLRKDPPPELVLEVDITSSSIPRLPIYATLRVPEIWRYDGRTLECLHLRAGEYRPAIRSLVFPFLEPAQLLQFIARMEDEDDTSILRKFVKWIRKNGWPVE